MIKIINDYITSCAELMDNSNHLIFLNSAYNKAIVALEISSMFKIITEEEFNIRFKNITDFYEFIEERNRHKKHF